VELAISELAGLEPGRIFYSGRLYVIEAVGTAAKARPWDMPSGTLHGIVATSRQSALARFHPVIERAMVLPTLKRSDFLLGGRPLAYVFKSETDARRAAQLDRDLAQRSGLHLHKISRAAVWVLTDGGTSHRVYHYPLTSVSDEQYAAYRVAIDCVESQWPDEHTPYWALLFR